MFIAVTLAVSLKNIYVPDKWINKFHLAEDANCGVNSRLMRIVYFSADKAKSADFSLPLNQNFDETRDGCYNAYIIKYFGK